MNGLLVFYDQQLFCRADDRENVTKNILEGLATNGYFKEQEMSDTAELVTNRESGANVVVVKSSNLWWSIERTESHLQNESKISRFKDFICDRRYADSHILIQVSPLKEGVQLYCMGEERNHGEKIERHDLKMPKGTTMKDVFECLRSTCSHMEHRASEDGATTASAKDEEENRLCCQISKMNTVVTHRDTVKEVRSAPRDSVLFQSPESLSVYYSGYLGSKTDLKKDNQNVIAGRKKLIARLIKYALHKLSINERTVTSKSTSLIGRISTNKKFERVHGVKLMKTSLELCKCLTNLQPTKYLLHHSFAVIDSDNWYWSIEHDKHFIQIQRSREIDNVQYYRSGKLRKTNRCDRIKATHYKQVARSDVGTKTMKGYFDFISKQTSMPCAVGDNGDQGQSNLEQTEQQSHQTTEEKTETIGMVQNPIYHVSGNSSLKSSVSRKEPSLSEDANVNTKTTVTETEVHSDDNQNQGQQVAKQDSDSEIRAPTQIEPAFSDQPCSSKSLQIVFSKGSESVKTYRKSTDDNEIDQMSDFDYNNFLGSPLLTKYKIIDKNCQTISEFTYSYFMFAENAESNRNLRYFPCLAALFFLILATAFTGIFITVIETHDKLNAALKIMDADQMTVIFITASVVTTLVILALFLFAWGKNRILQYDNNELCRVALMFGVALLCLSIAFSLLNILFWLNIRDHERLEAKMHNKLKVAALKISNNWNYNNYIDQRTKWNNVHNSFTCCGVYNASDWIRALSDDSSSSNDDWLNNFTSPPFSKIPKSCGEVPEEILNRPGCEPKVMDFMFHFGFIFLAMIPFLFGLCIWCVMCVTACFSCSLKKNEDKWNENQLETYKIMKAEAS